MPDKSKLRSKLCYRKLYVVFFGLALVCVLISPLNALSAQAVLCGRTVPIELQTPGTDEMGLVGVWSGGRWNANVCGALVVETVSGNGKAQVTYIYGPTGPQSRMPWNALRRIALVSGGELTFVDDQGGHFAFRMQGGVLSAEFTDTRGRSLHAVFNKQQGMENDNGARVANEAPPRLHNPQQASTSQQRTPEPGDGLTITITPNPSPTALIVHGQIHNDTRTWRLIPKIRVAIRDAQENELAAKLVDAPIARLPAYATVPFETSFDVDEQATGVAASFVSDAGGLLPQPLPSPSLPNAGPVDCFIFNAERFCN